MKRHVIGSAALLCAALAFVSMDAGACGACFTSVASATADSVVVGHRMAFAVSATRTVLWDKFEYTGSPGDFAWVLPVKHGAILEASTDAWFESLEAVTKTRVSSPALQCANRVGGGCGFSASDSAKSAGNGAYIGTGVTVVHQGTVGPYDTVTLQSQSGSELTDWLNANGYAIQPDAQPIIDTYVSEGADFIALKLQPDKGIQEMTPVRVVTPGGDPILPLRMVAIGTGAHVSIVLYVIGEARYAMPDLDESTISLSDLTWDYSKNNSNYLELRSDALDQFLGHTYLTTYARRGAFYETAQDAVGSSVFYGSLDAGTIGTDNFSDLYFSQAYGNDGTFYPPSTCALNDIRLALESDDLVTEDGATGSPASRFTCKPVVVTGEPKPPYSDIAAAVIGMHPSKVWVTRLELNLPREALSMDCVVEAASSQERVNNYLLALHVKNRPSYCAEPVFTSRVARGSARPSLTVSSLFALLTIAFGFRRLRRKT
jgi:hypothetical protein